MSRESGSPSSLKRFIARCYAEVPKQDHPEMERQLKDKVTKAIENGQQWSIDWDHVVLPIQSAQLASALVGKPLRSEEPVAKPLKSALAPKAPGIVKKLAPSVLRQSPRVKKTNTANEKTVPEAIKQGQQQLANGRLQSPTPAAISTTPPVTLSDVEKRRQRFQQNHVPLYVDELSLEPVVGRSTALEKSYLRLTSAPNPDVVRPKRILKKAVKHVIARYETEQKYSWVADQLRAIRQDLTVQHIADPFTVKVYEQNARIALENKDLGEYNQCLTRLKELYESGMDFTSNETAEFMAYRIFYLLYTQQPQALDTLLETAFTMDDPAVQHALAVVSAYRSGDRPKLFALYGIAPNLGRAAMQQFIGRERVIALHALTQAIKPVIPLSMVSQALGFQSMDAAREFLAQYLPTVPETELVCSAVSSLFDQAKETLTKIDIKGQV